MEWVRSSRRFPSDDVTSIVAREIRFANTSVRYCSGVQVPLASDGRQAGIPYSGVVIQALLYGVFVDKRRQYK